MKVDNILGPASRFYDRREWLLPLGSRGERLFAACVKCRPGFGGSLGFVHPLDLSDLFVIHLQANRDPLQWNSLRAWWYPSHVLVKYQAKGLQVEERKFITHDDCAVSHITITNTGYEFQTLSASVTSPFFPGRLFTGGLGLASHKLVGKEWSVMLALGEEFGFPHHLGPGDTLQMTITCLFAPDKAEAQARYSRIARSQSPFEKHQLEYEQWFARVPAFKCSDGTLTRLWYYRWWLVYWHLCRPGVGNLKDWCAFEGLHQAAHAVLNPAALPFQLLETRWYQDPSLAVGLLNTALDNDLLKTRVFAHDDSQPTWLTAAAWSAGQVQPAVRDVVLQRLEPFLFEVKAALRGWDAYGLLPSDNVPLPLTFGLETDSEPEFLLASDIEGTTAPKDSTPSPVHSVTAACYHLKNLEALCNLLQFRKDFAEVEQFQLEAAKVREALLQHMWDEERGWFFDLVQVPAGAAPALARAHTPTLAGLLPFWAQAAGPGQAKAFRHLAAGGFFEGSLAFPTRPLAAPGAQLSPYWESLAAYALLESRKYAPEAESSLVRLLESYVELHSPGKVPEIHRAYSAATSQPLAERYEPDHFNSAGLDLMVRVITGLQPEAEGLRLAPVDTPLDWFSFEDLPFRGRLLTVTWRKPGFALPPRAPDLAEGFRVSIDGREVYSAPALEAIELPLEPA